MDSTEITKFGNSLYLDGSSYLSLNNSITLGDNDFTIDYWAYADSNQEMQCPFTIQTTNSTATGYRIFNYLRHGTSKRCESGINLSSNTYSIINEDFRGSWLHWAHVYEHSNSTFKTYVNGVLKATQSITLSSTTYSYTFIGRPPVSSETKYLGYIDEFRISNIARYTTNFTPSIVQYSKDDNTVVLLHF